MSFDLAHVLLFHSFIILGEAIIILVIVHMLYKRRSPTSMIAWLLFIILVPYIAVILYFIFGSRKRQNRYKKDHIKLQKHNNKYNTQELNPIDEVIKSYGVADMNKNQYFRLYTNSTKSYEILIDCIKNAKISISMSTYVFKYDDVTTKIINELIKRANDGVKIQILIDSLGSWKLYFLQYHLNQLRDSGVKVEFFMPIFKMPFRNYINLRNHRKIYLFDNSRVLSGGLNLSNEYLGSVPNKSRWDDILFLVEGKSVELFFDIFASDWFYASGENLKFKNEKKSKEGDTSIQVVPSGPDMSKDVLYETLLCAIFSAKKRIWIVTPYFVPDASLSQALIIAKHKGLDIKLITPKTSNHLIADLTRSSYMRELEEEGIEISLHNGEMLHAKAIIFDDMSVMLGSVNLDNRSLFLNYEIATFVYSDRIIKETEAWMKKLLSHSEIGTKKVSNLRVIIENLMRIIAPQL